MKRDPALLTLGGQMRTKVEKVSAEEWEELEKLADLDSGFSNVGPYQRWNPSEKAGHTPKPLLLKPKTNKKQPTWSDYLIDENFGQDWIILGAGEGALSHAKEMDGKIVYGINWTTRWFRPSFIQVVDGQVWQEEIRSIRVRRAEEDTQVVASKWIANQRAFDDEIGDYLLFDIINPNKKRTMEARQFAESPKETMGWAPNSLFFALNIIHWFRPRRIALVGFDFGGAHFFGDGRQVGSSCDYGFGSAAKGDLHDRLRWMRDEMEARGNVIRHVRPTKLDVFKQVDTIDEALA